MRAWCRFRRILTRGIQICPKKYDPSTGSGSKSAILKKMADFRFTMVYTRSGAFEGSFPMFSRSADSLMTPEVAYGHRKWALGTGNGCSRYFPRAQKPVECLYLRFRTRWIHSWHRQWSLGTGSGPNMQEAGTVIPGAGVSHK